LPNWDTQKLGILEITRGPKEKKGRQKTRYKGWVPQ